MAKVEIMTMGPDKSSVLNIGHKVGWVDLNGERGANQPDDVMLIQGMFRFIKKHNSGCDFSKAAQYGDLPEVTGIVNSPTLDMIDLYQRVNARKLLKVDRVIEPASYQNRNIVLTAKHHRLMTITLLNMDCSEGVLFGSYITGYSSSGGGGFSRSAVLTYDYIKAFTFEFPQLNLIGP